MPFRLSNEGPMLLLCGALMLAVTPVNICGQSAAGSAGAGAAVSADAVRAAYLLNFTRFTEWPANVPDGVFTIGVVNNRELEDRLLRLTEGKLLPDNKRIRVRRLTSPVDVPECQLIYIQPATRTEASVFAMADWLNAARGHPVLTVSDEEGFIARGGIINFYAESNTLRFEISPKAAEQAGLKVSSRLLAIARVITTPDTARSSTNPVP